MLSLSLMLFVGAAPVSIAVPGVSCVGLDQQLCDSFLDRFVAVLSEGGSVRTVTQKDIAQVLGLERQRQLLGCNDASNSSCLAELAGALGVDGVVAISIARSDPYFVATARVVHTRDGSQWTSASERVGREGELFDVMDSIATKFRSALGPASGTPGERFLRWTPAIVGGVALIAGTAIFLSADTQRTQLLGGMLPVADVQGAVESGRTKQQLGVGLWLGGGVALAASLLWVLLTPIEDQPKVVIAPIAGGAALVFGGKWP